MRYVFSILSIVCLCGCKPSVHTSDVVNVPKAKITKTITETTKIERPVPVYRTDVQLQSKTHTVTSDDKPVAPLHQAVVTPLLQEAK